MSHLVPDSVTPEGLTAFLHEQIPLSQAMGLRAIETNALRVVLEAPLNANRNHLGTAFGGSLHTMATLAGYAAVWMLMREAGLDGHVLLKRSECDYRTPVKGALRATCARPQPARTNDFIAAVRRHRKARMELTATIEGVEPGKPAVEFRGMFVAVV